MTKLLSAAAVSALLVSGYAAGEIEDAPDTERERTLDAIIVTGEKIDRSLQDTTTSVSVSRFML